jgi:hypothetical protein
MMFTLQLFHGPHTIMDCWLVVGVQKIGTSAFGTWSQNEQQSV